MIQPRAVLKWSLLAGGGAIAALLIAGALLTPSAHADSHETATPAVVADSPEAAGRYLIVVGGCNDCHTDGYLRNEGDVPESAWLKGSGMGWRGPWGTTYAANLRLTVLALEEDDWVDYLHEGGFRPPMPNASTAGLSEADARAIYRYIRTLAAKDAGGPVPGYVPPDREPGTPYMNLTPVFPEGMAPPPPE